MMRKLLLFTSIFVAGSITTLVLSGRMSSSGEFASAADARAPIQGRGMLAATPSTLPDLSSVAERALKVSANIASTEVVRTRTDPWFQMFYGQGPISEQQYQTAGSGVIVSQDGYVLTNNHVVASANAGIVVTLPDNRELKARVIGVDDVTDLAVLKVDATNLPTLPWADSSQLHVAEWVLAVGNPFQFSGTVTLGIISATARPGALLGAATNDLIQTDAAINPGNSGGALVNAKGELVGINSMIYTETGNYVGIGFAIPVNTARQIMDELIKNGSVHWGSIGGVVWQTVDAPTADRAGYGPVAGVFVRRSAGQGGLRSEDIIVGFNGQTITTAEQLSALIIKAAVGSTAKIEVVRGGKHVTLDVPIVNREPQRGRGGR